MYYLYSLIFVFLKIYNYFKNFILTTLIMIRLILQKIYIIRIIYKIMKASWHDFPQMGTLSLTGTLTLYRMIAKKCSLLLMNVYVLYVLEMKTIKQTNKETNKQKFPSVCLSARWAVCVSRPDAQ